MVIKKGLALATLCSSIMFAAFPVSASGSGGGYGSGSINYPAPSAPRDPYADAYARGKSQFKKRITCRKCAHPDGVHDSVTAAIIAKSVNAGKFELSEKQRADAMIFLQRRYGVKA